MGVCKLCRKPSDQIYAVQPGKEEPLCGVCLGRWSPRKLDALLGMKQADYGSEPKGGKA